MVGPETRHSKGRPVIIDARYNGPPGTGNGGYSAGLVATHIDGPAVVTLRQPPPLDVALIVDRTDDRVVVTAPDGSVVAEAQPATITDAVVPPASWAEAVAASQHYQGFRSHPFPTCFVCGPQRAVGSGLRLFPGRLADGRTATPWTAPGDVSAPVVWASLDCPGGWAISLEDRPYVLGRLAAQVDGLPSAGEQCVVTGELIAEQGRKAHVRTTLYSSTGHILARSRATWLAI
jgi:hypothetical protein